MDLFRLLDWLWDASWQGALFAAAVWGLLRLLPALPARWCYLLWMLVVVKFLLPPVGEFPSALFSRTDAGAVSGKDAVKITAPQLMQPKKSPVHLTRAYDPCAVPLKRPYVSEVGVAQPERRIFTPDVFLITWLAGVFVMLIILRLRWERQRRLLRDSQPAPDALQALLGESATAMGLRKAPGLRYAALAGAPMLVGVLRPVILLPPDILSTCHTGDVRAHLLHECAHIKRRDLVALWLQQCAQTLFFFHPAIWLAGHALAVERELACDEEVLRHSTISPRAYAAGYVSILRLVSSQRACPAALGMAEPFATAQRRLHAMLASPRRIAPHWWAVLALVILVGVPTFRGCSSGHRGVGMAKAPWPCAGGNACNSGVGTGTPVTGQSIRSIAVDGSPITTSPAINANGKLYLVSESGTVYALDGKTGKRFWSASIRDSSLERLFSSRPQPMIRLWRLTPALGANGLLYVVSPEGKLYALDAATGRRKWRCKWRFNTNSGLKCSSPAIGPDGTVYIASDDNGGKFYALDGNTGRKRWEYVPRSIQPSGMPITGSTRATPAIGPDGTVYLTSNVGVFALDGKTGKTRWTFSPYHESKHLVTGVFVLDSKTGKKRWTTRPYQQNKQNPVLSPVAFNADPVFGPDGTLYVGAYEGYTYALDSSTGKQRWSFKLPTLINRNSGKPLTDLEDRVPNCPAVGPDGTLYCTTAAGRIYALDCKNGREKWMQITGLYFLQPPVIGADGTVYVASADDRVFVIDSSTGNTQLSILLWNSGKDKLSTRSSMGADGTLYIGSEWGKIYAVH